VLHLSNLGGSTRLDLPHQLAHSGRGIARHLTLSLGEVEDAPEHGEGIADCVRCLTSVKLLAGEEKEILLGDCMEFLLPKKRCQVVLDEGACRFDVRGLPRWSVDPMPVP
jgi:hypothetical protein